MKRKEATHNGNKRLVESRSMGNVRTTGNAFGGFPPSCTKLGMEDKATITRRMSAVRYQELTQSLTALDWKKKKGMYITGG